MTSGRRWPRGQLKLNDPLIERWLPELTNRKLRRPAHCSVIELETDIRK
jgi:hypothetical protein